MRVKHRPALDQRASLTSEIHSNPYNLKFYLQRAGCYEELGFADLAAGDAYRALLLTDEILDESGEYHERAIEALDAAHKQPNGVGEADGRADKPVNGDVNADSKDHSLSQNGHAGEARNST